MPYKTWFSTRYQSVPHESGTDVSQPPNAPKTSYRLITLSLAIFTASVSSTLLILSPKLFKTSDTFIQSCGSSSISARSLGCIFDIMSFSWLPPPYSDAELTHEFESLHDWSWYVDANPTLEVPKTEVLLGNATELYVSWDYRCAHCTFMWKKLHRAVGRRGLVDSYIGSYNHTTHCEHMLLMSGAMPEDVNTKIVTKFSRCQTREILV